MENLTQLEITRQDMLSIWLKRQNMNQADIARKLEVAEVSVSRWFRANTISEKRHGQLVKLGIPPELLPAPFDITPGPKRKTPPRPIIRQRKRSESKAGQTVSEA